MILAASAAISCISCNKAEEKEINTPVNTDGITEVSEGNIDYEDGLSTERYDGYNFRTATDIEEDVLAKLSGLEVDTDEFRELYSHYYEKLL